jgi:ABC-2 type transport system ATP-binding protein
MDIQIMITVSGLTKHYGDRIAVHEMSFDVAAGRVTGFVGPNGAGKSTTMRMMVGLTRPDHGDVRYHGVPYTRLLRPARIVGSVLDARCMHPGRTARNHLRATAALSAISADRIDEVLREVGLESAADQRAGSFSLGMRQRLALAGALLGEPEVLLLDEPSNGLDPDGIRWLRNSLSAFAARAGTVLVSSHLIGELEMFADDLIVVGGETLAAESVSSTLARGRSTVVVRTPRRPSSPAPASRGHRVRHLARPTVDPRRDHGDGVPARLRSSDSGRRDHRDLALPRRDPARDDELRHRVRLGLNRRAHLTHRIPPTASIRRDPCHCHDEGTHLHDHPHPPHRVGLGRASIAHRPSPPAISS